MTTTKTVEQVQEEIWTYVKELEATGVFIASLETTDIRVPDETMPCEVEILPDSMDDPTLTFTGDTLVSLIHSDEPGVYALYTYEPLRTLQMDPETFLCDDCGAPMSIVCWRGRLWIPTMRERWRSRGTDEDELEALGLAPWL